MITIPLSTEDLTKVRLAPSPSGRRSLASGCCSTTGVIPCTPPGRSAHFGSFLAPTSPPSGRYVPGEALPRFS